MAYPDDVLKLVVDEHRLVFLSARWKANARGREQYDQEATVSFVYVDSDWAAEWETRSGPISVYHRADLPPSGEWPVPRKGAKFGDIVAHHIFPYVRYDPDRCSQLAVDVYGLPAALVDGEWEQIFHTLQNFVERTIEQEESDA